MAGLLHRDGLDALIAALKAGGYRVIGPRLSDDAIVYDDIDGIRDLPAGLGDEQEGGHYRLRKRGDDALFGYTLAPQGWKRYLHPPRERLFAARRTGSGFVVQPPDPPGPPFAFIGVRACELAAMALQAKVLTEDPNHQRRLRDAFVVAVECREAGATCFCASMGTGPEVRSGFDIRLVEEGDHFVADAGSERGAALLGELPEAAPPQPAEFPMGRIMDTKAAAALKEVPEHPRWADVAARCLACGNCTMVCPTCFCTNVEDMTDLTGQHAERWQSWDSCFSVEFSYIHGGAVRTETRSRYRQWLTHKMSSWFDQFGSSGCVGCGRCITWCPVGIDVTAEVRAMAKGGE